MPLISLLKQRENQEVNRILEKSSTKVKNVIARAYLNEYLRSRGLEAKNIEKVDSIPEDATQLQLLKILRSLDNCKESEVTSLISP